MTTIRPVTQLVELVHRTFAKSSPHDRIYVSNPNWHFAASSARSEALSAVTPCKCMGPTATILDYGNGPILDVTWDHDLSKGDLSSMGDAVARLGWRVWATGTRGIAFKPTSVDLSEGPEVRTASEGSASSLAVQYWRKAPKSIRFEWLIGYLGDIPGGKTFAAMNDDNPSLQGILNDIGENLASWQLAGELADAVDGEAQEWKANGYKIPQPEEAHNEEVLDLGSILTSYVADPRMVSPNQLRVLIEAIEKNTVAPGLKFLERVQADNPRWQVGTRVTFSVASFSSVEFSTGGRAGNIAWKSTDKCIVRVHRPQRGLTVSYEGRKMHDMLFDAAAERETLLTGSYVVTEIRSIPEPGTPENYGYRIPLYVLREA